MRRPSVYQAVLLLCIGFILLFAWIPAQAQTPNLLTNPGFEPPFNTVDGDPPRLVAQGWTPWHVSASAGAPSYMNRQPEYYPTAPDTARIHSGNDAQQILSFFAVHTGGVYQRVTGVTSGAELTFSVYAYIWSTTYDEAGTSEEDGDAIVDVGIDPTGGTDGESENIIWSNSVETADSYDAYKEYTVEATAQGTAVTVFIRTTAGVPVKHNNFYVDDAVLTATGGEAQPETTEVPASTSTFTPIPSNTPLTPTSTTTNTAEPPKSTATNTLQPTVGIISTSTPEGQPLPATATPTETLTMTPAPTDTSAPPTNTEVPPTSTLAPSSPTPLVAEATSTLEAVEATPTATATEESKPISEEFPGTINYTVRRGDSVFKLATLYNSSIEAIAEANGLDDSYLIHVGQELIIPVKIVPVTSTPTETAVVIVVTATPIEAVPPIGTGNTYIVQRGDNLSRIARLFNTTVATLAQLNGIVNPDQIQVGQELVVPGSQPAPDVPPSPEPTVITQTYIVQRGDSLNLIAIRFGVTVGALVQVNEIRNPNLIYVGQLLLIP